MRAELRATYRLQLRPEFDLDQAAATVTYLERLGVSHVYCSPYLQAARGSTHGYDVVDPSRVSAELGGEEARRRLTAALDGAGLGQVIDIVPNHMAIHGDQNPWWWDVLEDGPASRFATFFDVDWEASDERWPNKVLLPVLGDHYGRILESGELRLQHRHGRFTLHYGDQAFPIEAASLAPMLAVAARDSGSALLEFLAESCARLPRPTVTDRRLVDRRHRDKAVILKLLARLCRDEPAIAEAIDAEILRLHGDADALDALIEAQNYRLAYWRTAGRDLGYRRFFDINDLAGLRVEDDAVFRAVHALPIAWVAEGSVQGLRVDHIDGLRDPREYLDRLHAACPDACIVVEKILHPGESLPNDWPVAGTTGYEFLNLAGGLFVDPRGEARLRATLEACTGLTADFSEVVHECKRLVLKELLGSELNRLVALLVAICERHRRHRDYTRQELYQVLLEVATCFPVYRSYVCARTGTVRESDRRVIAEAVRAAQRRRADLDAELFSFVQSLLSLERSGELEGELAMRFQQLTGPAMAKGVEDTAFYRFHLLAGLNEVGGDPTRFGVSPAEFHAACRMAAERHPRAMLATATHDTKRGEDVRARLALLSEIPDAWQNAVAGWFDHNERSRKAAAPDRAAEYLMYQTLVGAWPVSGERLAAYMEKAVREAKQYTSWMQPVPEYEDALREFIESILGDEDFCRSLVAFVEPLVAPGRVNGLAQTLLKLTCPGVPDIYQGCELWDLSLVDPDNRRPVDYAHRVTVLEQLEGLSAGEIVARMDEGLPKLWLIRQALHLRRRRAAAFAAGASYEPLGVLGRKAENAVAYLRGGDVAIVVPRLVLGLAGDWADAECELPQGGWFDVLAGVEVAGGRVPLAGLLAHFPVALLERSEAR